jgi:hypothetical protein
MNSKPQDVAQDNEQTQLPVAAQDHHQLPVAAGPNIAIDLPPFDTDQSLSVGSDLFPREISTGLFPSRPLSELPTPQYSSGSDLERQSKSIGDDSHSSSGSGSLQNKVLLTDHLQAREPGEQGKGIIPHCGCRCDELQKRVDQLEAEIADLQSTTNVRMSDYQFKNDAITAGLSDEMQRLSELVQVFLSPSSHSKLSTEELGAGDASPKRGTDADAKAEQAPETRSAGSDSEQDPPVN